MQVDFRKVLDISIWPSAGDQDSLETAGAAAASRREQGTSLETGPGQQHPAAVALREAGHPQLSFGFSAGGLLFPYYIGVIYRLHDLGVITRALVRGHATTAQHWVMIWPGATE